MSLRIKTIVGVALIEATLLVLLVTMTLNYLRDSNYDALVKRATTTATLFASTTKDAVLSYDLASLQSFADQFLLIPDILYVRIVDKHGRIFAKAGSDYQLGRKFVDDFNPAQVNDGVYDTHIDISEGGESFARVEFGIDINAIRSVIAEAEQRSVILALLEMGLVALFSLLLGTYLTRQLYGLRQAAKAIANGKLDMQVPVKGRDEIAEVSAAFNAMTENLREAQERRDQYERELRELNRSLEYRVDQRTQELKFKNLELEQANRQIRDAQAQLLQSEKMASVGLLAAGVAHEINNPMSFIMSNLRTLQFYVDHYQALLKAYEDVQQMQGEEAEQQWEKIDRLRVEADLEFMNEDIIDLLKDSVEGSERVRDIVAGLKDFSRADSMENFVLCDLNDCIRSTLKVSINEFKYHCDVVTELDELPQTCCRPGQINQVILNMLVNAGQAIEGHGKINIHSRCANDQIFIDIEDTGTGIPEDKLSKIFDPFYTSKPIGQGTGLGLAISYGIVEEHGGHIEVRSEVGHGTCFTICLPVSEAPPTDHDQPHLLSA